MEIITNLILPITGSIIGAMIGHHLDAGTDAVIDGWIGAFFGLFIGVVIQSNSASQPNPATEPLRFTAFCLGAFHSVRWYATSHFESEYGGLGGAINALANPTGANLWANIVQWITVACAIAWVVLVFFIAVWIYHAYFTKVKVTGEIKPPIIKGH